MKLEGGAKRAEVVRALVNCEIPVMGHLGLTPQSVHAMGGFKVQGRERTTPSGSWRMRTGSRKPAASPSCSRVSRAELAARITASLDIPTIGIGAGPHCSGQVLVLHDVLGLTQGHRPKFVRTYADGFDLLQRALAHWAEDVRSGAFPSSAEAYALPADAHAAVAAWVPHASTSS